MDFYLAFRPIFILLILFVAKISCFRTEYLAIKLCIAVSALSIAVISETYFDNDFQNDSSLCILALPISIILISQAILDMLF